MWQFTPEQVLRLLEKHGLPKIEPEKGSFEGVVNEIWFAGDVVVRINKDLDFESDVWTETVAVPALSGKEILTPRLLAFDEDRDVVERLVTIYERMPGVPLSQVRDLADAEGFFFELGREIRWFHDAVTVVDDLRNYLDPAWFLDEAKAVERFDADSGLLVSLGEEPQVFCHQDLHPDNILVHEGKLCAIIDWGDAGWSSPSTDLRYIPARYLRSALEGYGEISDETMRRIVLHQMDQFIYSTNNSRSYGVYGDSTRAEVEALSRK